MTGSGPSHLSPFKAPLLTEERRLGDAARVDGAEGNARGAVETLVEPERTLQPATNGVRSGRSFQLESVAIQVTSLVLELVCVVYTGGH